MNETTSNSQSNTQIVIGVIGIFILLVVALLFALWESNRYYQPEQINQFVEQQAGMD